MRAVWLEDRTLRLRHDAPLPSPRSGEALVRVRYAGVCGTDLELTRGYYPYAGIPGHEFVGRVAAAEGAEAWIGRRVVGEINAACHVCAACRAGRTTHCENRSVLGIKARDGAFAEYLTLPVENLHEVPPGVPDEVAVFAEPLAAALEIQRQVAIGPAERVAVIGDGRLAQLVAQTLALTAATSSSSDGTRRSSRGSPRSGSARAPRRTCPSAGSTSRSSARQRLGLRAGAQGAARARHARAQEHLRGAS
jgi:threonine dehydrogenase-like Zn-dependent dehydrogenase